jgi:probable HAF family extracellular repeat protein
VTDLGSLLDHSVFPYSEAMGINDSGKVVGWLYRGGAVPSAQPTEGEGFLYDSASSKVTYLGALNGDLYSRARAINDSGKVVGLSRGPNGQRAFLWEDGEMKDLHALIPAGSPLKLIDAYAINESGQIVVRLRTRLARRCPSS